MYFIKIFIKLLKAKNYKVVINDFLQYFHKGKVNSKESVIIMLTACTYR